MYKNKIIQYLSAKVYLMVNFSVADKNFDIPISYYMSPCFRVYVAL